MMLILLTFPHSTVAVERLFSRITHLKDKYTNRLSTESI